MKLFYIFIFLLLSASLTAQNFNGQWKGGFNESSYGFSGLGGSQIDYVLELQTKGSDVSGYSYTYFNEGSKRYYTICKLTGTVNKAAKDIVVTEIERVKYNTPPNFQNCFQTHRLHYEQDSSDTELLRGTWIPAPNQTGNCGYGTTLLSRRVVKRMPLGITSIDKNIVKTTPKKNSPPLPRTQKPVVKQYVKPKPPIVKKEELVKEKIPDISENKKPETTITPYIKIEPRRKDIIKTIPISEPTFRVDFYDNGEIDGDSITVIYNGKVVLSHKMLSAKAITLNLSLDEDVRQNIITMYADNLGSIPPNTALMIVTDGDKRYEVRITSDTEKSGSVVFVHGE